MVHVEYKVVACHLPSADEAVHEGWHYNDAQNDRDGPLAIAMEEREVGFIELLRVNNVIQHVRVF